VSCTTGWLAPGSDKRIKHERLRGCEAGSELPGLSSTFARSSSTEDDFEPSRKVNGKSADQAGRTTVMLRNLKQSCSGDELSRLLEEHGFTPLYDFVYVPMNLSDEDPTSLGPICQFRHMGVST